MKLSAAGAAAAAAAVLSGFVGPPGWSGSALAAAETASAQPTLKSCNKQADAKGLTGKERAAFVKECLAGKSP